MTNTEIVEAVGQYYPALSRVFQLAFRNVQDSVSMMGHPTKVERSNWMRTAVRTELRLLCDHLDPIVQLIEEPDGEDLNFLLFDLADGKNLALRWGRYGNGRINRNDTARTRSIQQDGLFDFAAKEQHEQKISFASIGYDVADDFTEAGEPAWWLQRIVLLIERPKSSEFIHEICAFDKPDRKLVDGILTDDAIDLRLRDRIQIERIADRLRKKLG